MRTIRHQPRGLRQRTCALLKQLLQDHTNCHQQWAKRRDSESLKEELAGARWAWLGPTLLERAYDGGEHAVNDGLIGLESAGKRAALAETGAWTELFRLYVRDMLAREADARGDGTHTLQQSTALKADTMRASDKMDSCNIRAALPILLTNTRAPPNIQTAGEVHSLVAVDTDEQETARIKMQCATIKQAAMKFSSPPAKLVKRMARVLCWQRSRAPAVGGRQTSRPLDARRGDQPCCVNGWACGRRLWFHTRQLNSGRRPQLLRLTVDRRSLSLGSSCRSHAHARSAQLRWQKSWWSWRRAAASSNTLTGSSKVLTLQDNWQESKPWGKWLKSAEQKCQTKNVRCHCFTSKKKAQCKLGYGRAEFLVTLSAGSDGSKNKGQECFVVSKKSYKRYKRWIKFARISSGSGQRSPNVSLKICAGKTASRTWHGGNGNDVFFVDHPWKIKRM